MKTYASTSMDVVVTETKPRVAAIQSLALSTFHMQTLSYYELHYKSCLKQGFNGPGRTTQTYAKNLGRRLPSHVTATNFSRALTSEGSISRLSKTVIFSMLALPNCVAQCSTSQRNSSTKSLGPTLKLPGERDFSKNPELTNSWLSLGKSCGLGDPSRLSPARLFDDMLSRIRELRKGISVGVEPCSMSVATFCMAKRMDHQLAVGTVSRNVIAMQNSEFRVSTETSLRGR